MKPLKLEFQAFGPYVNLQRIDFDALAKQGLFLIRGETGAGKTTILDAITYALYGRSSGGLRGDLASMRCQAAPTNLQTEVVFDFEQSGRIYRFTRHLRARHKRNGEIDFLPGQDAFYQDDNGVFHSFFENPKAKSVEEKAVELIGLGYEQFRQVVILPQGQFERLLVANSEEKERILTTLFAVGPWEAAARLFAEQTAAQGKVLEEQAARQAAMLSTYGCETAEQLAEKHIALTQKLAQSRIVFEKRVHEKSAAEQAQVKAQALAREFEILDEATEKRRRLTAPAMQEETARMRKLMALRELSVRVSEAATQRKQMQTAQSASENAAKQVQTAESTMESVKQALSVLSASQQRLQEVQLALLTAEGEAREFERRRQLHEQIHALTTKITTQEQCVQKQEQEEQTCVALSQNRMNAHLAQLAGELAENLQEGMPCPVCGSTSHPVPAKPVAEGRATREQVAQANKALHLAQKAAAEARSTLSALRTQQQQQRIDLEEQGGYDAAAHAAHQEQTNVLQKEAAQSSKIAREISHMEADLEKQALLLKTAQEAQQRAKETLLRMETTLMVLEKQIVALDPHGEGRALLAEHPQNATDFDRLSRELELRDAALSAASETERTQREKLMQQERPPLEELAAQVRALSAALLEQKGEIAVLEGEEARLESDAKKLQKLQADYAEKRAVYDADFSFARLLRGISGVSLQRYVLGVMLSAVTQEANRLLQRVHNGRYQIFRTLSTSGSVWKAGLEFEVLDRSSDTRRSVVTLSGGEKFLVALALSIGLSTTVQAQSGGTQLGAIFIDEGFGTLDEASLYDALHVLSAIQNTRGMVGIISHVGLLRESIGAAINVHKDKKGSSLTVQLPD